jgi:hypothetical protein
MDREPTDFQLHLANLFEENEIPFQVGASISGVTPDFVIESPRGGVIVVEAKDYEPDTEGQVRAYQLVRYYKDVLRADRAFVVLPFLEQSRFSEGLVTERRLLEFLLKEFRGAAVVRRTKSSARISRGQREVFAAMPFSPEYNDVYFVSMAGACERVQASCWRVDREEFTGDVVDRIRQMIQQSAAVIADLSESRPNVLYEVGYAHALSKPTVHISSSPLEELPFDVHSWNTLQYSKGQTFELVAPLAARLSALIR